MKSKLTVLIWFLAMVMPAWAQTTNVVHGDQKVAGNSVVEGSLEVKGAVHGAATTNFFVSTNINIAGSAGLIASIPHNLGSEPIMLRWVAVCVVTNAGYAVGDELSLDMFNDGDSDGSGYGDDLFYWGANSTNVFVGWTGGGTPQLLSSNGVASTAPLLANWKLKCYAWKP